MTLHIGPNIRLTFKIKVNCVLLILPVSLDQLRGPQGIPAVSNRFYLMVIG